MNKTIIFLTLILTSLLISCSSQDEPPQPKPVEYKRSILVYMVASNSLAGNDLKDINEIIEGLNDIDINKFNILVYRCGINGKSTLSKFTKSNNYFNEVVIKDYIEDDSSVSINRISEVISDMEIHSPSNEYGLILWSHAMAWIPSKLKLDENLEAEPCYFGDDFGKHIDIDKLASTIPDNKFEFIWMDCCYMASIETAYEFRNKCKYYIGYPTEILGEGMPYNLTIPYLLKEKYDIIGAADATFKYFNNHLSPSKRSCTISILDMSKLNALSEATSKIMENFRPLNDTSKLQEYSRGSEGPFYDFRHYVWQVASQNETTSHLNTFDDALNNAIIYKNATNRFLSIEIDSDHFSGLSTHAYTNNDSFNENYYRSLSWFKDTYK